MVIQRIRIFKNCEIKKKNSPSKDNIQKNDIICFLVLIFAMSKNSWIHIVIRKMYTVVQIRNISQ